MNFLSAQANKRAKSSSGELLEIELEYYLYKELGKEYNNYKSCHFCKQYDILNVDELGKFFDYVDVTSFMLNPSKTHFSFCVDFVGNRNYHFFIKELYGNKITHIPLGRKHEMLTCVHRTFSQYNQQMNANYVWLNDNEILYVGLDPYYNDAACYTLNVFTNKRRMIYRNDTHKQLSLFESHSGFYYLLYAGTYNSDEVYLLDVENEKIHLIPTPVLPDKQFVKYPYIDHINATWYILKKSKGTFRFMKTFDFRHFETLFVMNSSQVSDAQEVHFLNNVFVFFFRRLGKCVIYTYSICGSRGVRQIDSADTPLCNSNACHCGVMNILPESGKIYFYTSSFVEQNKLFVLEIDRSQQIHLSKPEILDYGARFHDKKQRYCEEVVFLKKNTIMLTKIYKKGLVLKNAKCILYGYGSYGDHYDATYNTKQILSLCDRGFLVIISQVSGDGALGFKQRRNGMLSKKKNTFYDFIYIIEEYLFKNKITNRDKLVLWGRSAGGLLIGAVLNMRPDLCKAAVMGVPFVAPLLALSSEKTPLGFESHSEWGNPEDKSTRDYIASYSPYRNINPDGDYPHLFIYANLNDTLVPYTQPYRYYQLLSKKVGVYANKKKDLYLHIDPHYGHNQGITKKDKARERAIMLSFIEKYVN